MLGWHAVHGGVLYSLDGDWKSIVADRLHRRGLSKNAKALYGIDEPEPPTKELTLRELRERGKHLKANRKPQPTSLLGRLRAWLQP